MKNPKNRDATLESSNPTPSEALIMPNESKEQPMPLVEFCTRLSERDKRVELISGFESHERQAGRVNNTLTGFTAAYQDFITKPA